MSKITCKLSFFLLFLFSCGSNGVHDKMENEAVKNGSLILFVSDKGQKRAPFASHYFNEQAKKKGLNFYAGYRASNPFDLNKRTLNTVELQKFEDHNMKILHNGIQTLEKEDFDKALSIIHVGNLTSHSRIRNLREINTWKIPEMGDNWDLSIDLIKLSVDNLIARLSTTTSAR